MNAQIKPKPTIQPATVDAVGLPAAPCPVCQGRHYLRQAQDGARWYCSGCLLPHRGPTDPWPKGCESCTVPPTEYRIKPATSRWGGLSRSRAGD